MTVAHDNASKQLPLSRLDTTGRYEPAAPSGGGSGETVVDDITADGVATGWTVPLPPDGTHLAVAVRIVGPFNLATSPRLRWPGPGTLTTLSRPEATAFLVELSLPFYRDAVTLMGVVREADNGNGVEHGNWQIDGPVGAVELALVDGNASNAPLPLPAGSRIEVRVR